jgi:glycosyltransferase involved in cell wall biosynthesis
VAGETRKAATWPQVVSHLDPRYGGIAMSVPQLARATEAHSSHECPVLSFCDKEELAQIPAGQRIEVGTFPSDRIRWMVDTSLARRLKEMVRASGGVHIHGIWETHCMVTAGVARACKRPYMISAHGMLDHWALNRHRLKKALYAALVETRGLQRAACLRALTVNEVDDYRRLGLINPIAIVPSGIDAQPEINADLFQRAYERLAGKRIVLFLGRLHYKKGLRLLLQAWARVARRDDGIHLMIAGPDSEGTEASLERMTDELELRSSVTFAGMLNGAHKWSALARASLFVLPSYSEGFSIAVLEALAMGVTVVVTRQCHIPEVAVYGCGWVIEPEQGQLERTFEDFLRLSPDETAQMAERGRELVQRRFQWSVIGKQMAEVYDWLEGGAKPSGVEIA